MNDGGIAERQHRARALLRAGEWTRVRESAARARAIIDRVDGRAG